MKYSLALLDVNVMIDDLLVVIKWIQFILLFFLQIAFGAIQI